MVAADTTRSACRRLMIMDVRPLRALPCRIRAKGPLVSCAADTAIPLPAPAVERHGFKRADIDALEAPHVDRDHRRAVGLGATRERFDATDRAESVVNDLLVELIFG